MIFVVFAFMLVGFAQISRAQLVSFIKVYGNTGYDFGRDIKQDTDSGYVVTGSSSSFGGSDGESFLLKIDQYGDFVWSYNYGGTDSDWGESVVVTADSTYAICGHTNSYGAGGFDFYLVRADSLGEPIWWKTYGGADWDKAYDLVEMPDSGFVLVGETSSFSGTRDAYIVRTDKTGDTLWTKVIGGSGDEFLNAVYLDADSLVVCGGTSTFGAGLTDGYIAKMDLSGNIGWQKYVGSADNDFFTSVDAFNGYYVLCGINGYDYSNAEEDMWMYKLSDDGNIVHFDTTYPSFSPFADGVNDIAVYTDTEDLFYLGYSASWGFMMDGMPDLFFGKMTSSALFITANNYGEAGDDIGRALECTKDDGVIFMGDTKYYSTGGNNILIVKLSYLWEYPDQFTDLTYHDITTSLIDLEKPGKIGVYPNPCRDNLIINTNATVNEVNIVSMDGKPVTAILADDNRVDLSHLPAGIYILYMLIDGESYSAKITRN